MGDQTSLASESLIEELEDEQLANCVGGCALKLGTQLLNIEQPAEIPLGEPTGQTTSSLGVDVVSVSISSSLIGISATYNSNGSARYVSDRTVKGAFAEVDVQQVLEKVVSLPITTWKYNEELENIRHMGPMAQDFAAAFSLGDSDRSIQVVDANGVTLAAIQGLHQMMIEKNAELRALKAEIQTLKQLM